MVLKPKYPYNAIPFPGLCFNGNVKCVSVCITLGRGTALVFLEVNRVCMCAHNFYMCVCGSIIKVILWGYVGLVQASSDRKGNIQGSEVRDQGLPWTPAVTLTESGSAPQCLRRAQTEEGEEGERQRNRGKDEEEGKTV